MKGPKDQYTKEMLKKFGYNATWEPARPMALGQVGIIDDGIFTQFTDLQQLGILFTVLEDDTPATLEYASEGSVTITAKASGVIAPIGSVLGQMDAGFTLEFKNERSTYFKANNTRSPRISNAADVGKEVLKLYAQGKWDKHWVVITELVTAESATVLISNSKEGKVELKASVSVPDGRALDIADPSFEFSMQFTRGMDTTIIGDQGMTPLYRAMGLKMRLLAKPIFHARGLMPLAEMTPAVAKAAPGEALLFDYVNGPDML